jgi:hypothetical protein
MGGRHTMFVGFKSLDYVGGHYRARLGVLATPRLLQIPARSVAHSGPGGTGAQAVTVGRSV